MATRSKRTTAPKPEPDPQRQIATIEPPRLPYDSRLKEQYGVDLGRWRALIDSIFPAATTFEGVTLALSYCKARGLDPFKRPVHVVPIWSKEKNRLIETVWPGINELRTTAFRTKLYAGCDPTEFGPTASQVFRGEEKRGNSNIQVERSINFPQWARVTVYRMIEGERYAFPGPTVFWLSTYGTAGRFTELPNERWRTDPSYMLEKCAEAAALRKAFPEEIGDHLSFEEAEHSPPEELGSTPAPERPKRADFDESSVVTIDGAANATADEGTADAVSNVYILPLARQDLAGTPDWIEYAGLVQDHVETLTAQDEINNWWAANEEGFLSHDPPSSVKTDVEAIILTAHQRVVQQKGQGA